MNSLRKLSIIVVIFLVLSAVGPTRQQEVQGNKRIATENQARALEHDVRAFGAKGDGRTLDTDAINKAIEAAAAAGGGTVRFGAGRYLSFSIRLRSHITLYPDHGATIVAADPKESNGS